ncbi:hypothetical protein NQ315_011308 [Exocentrus adspersus]|uniref:DDE Tnp4 domain-containing protein n=1 Tax=Exocentrus adspersus TaxID=1586481 RepID=A0AAV8VKH7_9CUCU|nr:hypothetical protein NQ315_011308 [Exocentrus adspersus]
MLKCARKKKLRRRLHVHSLLQKRERLGTNLLTEELRLDSYRFWNYLRMSSEMFDELLRKIGSYIAKTDIWREDIINPTQRLALTIRFLASGDSMSSLYYAYRISLSSVSNIIRETTQVIWDILAPEVFLKCTSNEWKDIARNFETKWNFPHCIGAIDGKHVVIQAPKNSGSLYYNYKHSHSLVLLAVADANYCFSIVDIGGRGRESDGGIFKSSNMGRKLVSNELNVPSSELISDRLLPYVIVADEAFQLTHFMLRPYPGRSYAILDVSKQVFNYRHSRARRIIENTFGILAAKWRIYRKPMICDVSTAENIVKSTVCLHNFINKNDREGQYVAPGYVDYENSSGDVIHGAWRKELQNENALRNISRTGANTFGRNAGHVRDMFAEYFCNEGAIPWQWNRSHN